MKHQPIQYVALDVHQATVVVSVRDEQGAVVMRATVATDTKAVVGLVRGLGPRVHVAFEEGTQAQWLHDVLAPHAERVVVCNIRGRGESGNKSDRLDAADWRKSPGWTTLFEEQRNHAKRADIAVRGSKPGTLKFPAPAAGQRCRAQNVSILMYTLDPDGERMPKQSFVEWAAANAGVLSVTGALIIFFSWAITNTLGQRYILLKQSVENAEANFRLYSTLHELRSSLNSVAMESVYTREAAEQHREGSSSREDRLVDLRRQYTHTRLSAHQIKELMDFANQTLEFSSSFGAKTNVSDEVGKLNDRIYTIYRQLNELDRLAERANDSPAPDMATLELTVAKYVAFTRDEAIPQVRALYDAIINASNTRRAEGRAALARAKRNSTWAARAALFLYIVGSAIALGAQYFDKVHKKEEKKATAGFRVPAA